MQRDYSITNRKNNTKYVLEEVRWAVYDYFN